MPSTHPLTVRLAALGFLGEYVARPGDVVERDREAEACRGDDQHARGRALRPRRLERRCDGARAASPDGSLADHAGLLPAGADRHLHEDGKRRITIRLPARPALPTHRPMADLTP